MDATINRPSRSRGRQAASILLAGLVGLFLGAAAVWVIAWTEIHTITQQRDDAVAERQAVTEDLGGQLGVARSREALLQTRVDVLTAANQIERQNYGLAAETLQHATRSLAAADVSWLTPENVTELQDVQIQLDLARTEVAVGTPDQADRLRDVADRLGKVVGEPAT